MEMNVLPLTTLALPHTRLLRGGDLGAVLIDACVADECIVLSSILTCGEPRLLSTGGPGG